MARIKINDLPELTDVEVREAKGTLGGALMEPTISRDEFSTDLSLDKFDDPLLLKSTTSFDDPLLKTSSTSLIGEKGIWGTGGTT